MATGSFDANGIWLYGEDDSEPTASALLNKLGSSVTSKFTSGRLTVESMPLGSILQVAQVTKVDVFSTTSTSYVDITGLTRAISPQSTTNKILVMVNLNLGNTVGDGGAAQAQVLRGTNILGNAAGGSSMAMANPGGTNPTRIIGHSSYMFIDSPATTGSITYKVQLRATTGTAYLNRSGLSSNEQYVSSITLMEVKA